MARTKNPDTQLGAENKDLGAGSQKKIYKEDFNLVSSVRKAALTRAGFFSQEGYINWGTLRETITLTRPFSLYGRNDLPVKLYEML